MARRRIKIESKNLPRAEDYGQAFPRERRIVIDVDIHKTERELLDTVCHEVLHVASEDLLSENAVEAIAADLTDVLTRMKWRRIH